MRKKIVFYFLMSVLVLFAVELGLHVFSYIKDSGEPDDKTGKYRIERYELSAFSETSWGKEYWDEIRRARTYEYYPFIDWRRKEFHGKYVNISADGIRKTWNPEFGNEKYKRVYMFGGSTVWGYGSRDDFTISSLLSKRLNENKNEYSVVNYGENAYTFTQEIIYLTLLLKEGKRPDYVIFFDGINQVASSYRTGITGSINNLPEMKDIFERNKYRKKKSAGNAGLIREGLTGAIRDYSMIYQAFSQGLTHAVPNKGIKRMKTAPVRRYASASYSDDELNQLAEEIVSDYLQGLDYIKSLSKIYGFKYIFLWQPVLFSKAFISSEERTYRKAWKDRQRRKLFEKVYKIMGTKKVIHLYNLSTIFNGIESTIFVDFMHITEQGNEIVVDRIYEILEEERRMTKDEKKMTNSD